MSADYLPYSELLVVPLNLGIDLSSFDCRDADLNDFLKRDAFAYQKSTLAQTYVCLYANSPVGFFSVCADAINLSKIEKKTEFGLDKPHKDFPAIKIARLATANAYAGRHVGTFMVQYAVGMALEFSKKIGCRFVTVDALPNSVKFYEGLNFIRNLEDVSGKNVSMRLDLIDSLKN